MRSATGPSRALKVALVAVSLVCLSARADDAAEDNVKVAFISNFIKYTEWPASVQGGKELFVCSLTAQALSGKLHSLQGRLVQGRELQVRAAARLSDWRACQVLFIAADQTERVASVLHSIESQPILTIRDAPGFAKSGGMIGTKMRAGRIRFEINQGAARAAGLALSSQLLKLADEVFQ
jgi:hypothetical protein